MIHGPRIVRRRPAGRPLVAVGRGPPPWCLVAADLVPGPWAVPPGARALVPGPWCLQMRMRLIHDPRGRGPKKRAGSLAARALALFYAVDFT